MDFVHGLFACFYFPFKAFFQKGEAFDEGLSRAGGIEAEEAVSFRSEDVSHVEPEVAVIDDFVLEVFVGKAVGGSVDPEEVGAFRFDEFHLRQVFLEVISREVDVQAVVFLDGVEPFAAQRKQLRRQQGPSCSAGHSRRNQGHPGRLSGFPDSGSGYWMSVGLRC